MSKKEIAQSILDVIEKRGLRIKDAAIAAGISDSNVHRFLKHHDSLSLGRLILLLDSLDLKFVVEDKGANWGLDERLRCMPKFLYCAGRMETRTMIQKEGFYPRVDLFETTGEVLSFFPTPCDIYEIRADGLIRKNFDLFDHPFGTMYSYNEHIPPELINHRSANF